MQKALRSLPRTRARPGTRAVRHISTFFLQHPPSLDDTALLVHDAGASDVGSEVVADLAVKAACPSYFKELVFEDLRRTHGSRHPLTLYSAARYSRILEEAGDAMEAEAAGRAMRFRRGTVWCFASTPLGSFPRTSPSRGSWVASSPPRVRRWRPSLSTTLGSRGKNVGG